MNEKDLSFQNSESGYLDSPILYQSKKVKESNELKEDKSNRLTLSKNSKNVVKNNKSKSHINNKHYSGKFFFRNHLLVNPDFNFNKKIENLSISRNLPNYKSQCYEDNKNDTYNFRELNGKFRNSRKKFAYKSINNKLISLNIDIKNNDDDIWGKDYFEKYLKIRRTFYRLKRSQNKARLMAKNTFINQQEKNKTTTTTKTKTKINEKFMFSNVDQKYPQSTEFYYQSCKDSNSLYIDNLNKSKSIIKKDFNKDTDAKYLKEYSSLNLNLNLNLNQKMDSSLNQSKMTFNTSIERNKTKENKISNNTLYALFPKFSEKFRKLDECKKSKSSNIHSKCNKASFSKSSLYFINSNSKRVAAYKRDLSDLFDSSKRKEIGVMKNRIKLEATKLKKNIQLMIKCPKSKSTVPSYGPPITYKKFQDPMKSKSDERRENQLSKLFAKLRLQIMGNSNNGKELIKLFLQLFIPEGKLKNICECDIEEFVVAVKNMKEISDIYKTNVIKKTCGKSLLDSNIISDNFVPCSTLEFTDIKNLNESNEKELENTIKVDRSNESKKSAQDYFTNLFGSGPNENHFNKYLTWKRDIKEKKFEKCEQFLIELDQQKSKNDCQSVLERIIYSRATHGEQSAYNQNETRKNES